MNRNEQISAMLDGELDEAELRVLLEAMGEEETQAWQGYCAVGDLIRSSEMITFHSPDLLGRIASSLEREPTVVAPILATQISRQTALQRLFSVGRSRRLLASVAAVGFSVLHSIKPFRLWIARFKWYEPKRSTALSRMKSWRFGKNISWPINRTAFGADYPACPRSPGWRPTGPCWTTPKPSL